MPNVKDVQNDYSHAFCDSLPTFCQDREYISHSYLTQTYYLIPFMKTFNLLLTIYTCGYWSNYILRSVNVGFGLTIVALAIPALLYYFPSYAYAKQREQK
jgi:hypothetical protein